MNIPPQSGGPKGLVKAVCPEGGAHAARFDTRKKKVVQFRHVDEDDMQEEPTLPLEDLEADESGEDSEIEHHGVILSQEEMVEIFAAECQEWLNEYGPDLLAVEIQKKITAQKKKQGPPKKKAKKN